MSKATTIGAVALGLLFVAAIVTLNSGGSVGSDASTATELDSHHNNKIKMWVGYVKQERSCFKPGQIDVVIGGGSSKELLESADMVVLVELADRPSTKDIEYQKDHYNITQASCESLGGEGLDAQMTQKLQGTGRELVQIEQFAEDDPAEPDMSRVSVWYNPAVVKPGEALAYKNTYGSTSQCTGRERALNGDVMVTWDKHVSLCPPFKVQKDKCVDTPCLNKQYAASKSSLATSWHPTDGGKPFAILGNNAPSRYFKGKNDMLKRAMDGIRDILGVSVDRVFVVGDMNSRLLNSAYDVCTSDVCKETDFAKAVDMSKVAPQAANGGQGQKKPCTTDISAFNDTAACRTALNEMKACRQQCIADLACNPERMQVVGPEWAKIDPKRGAGGHELLAKYFTFPADMNFDPESSLHGTWRRPTYKRTPNSEVKSCMDSDPEFLGICDSNPCQTPADSQTCNADMSTCFAASSSTQADVLPSDDPLFEASSNGAWVSPEVGYLDTIGYSKGFDVTVLMLLDNPKLSFGDHGAFVSALSFSTGGSTITATKGRRRRRRKKEESSDEEMRRRKKKH